MTKKGKIYLFVEEGEISFSRVYAKSGSKSNLMMRDWKEVRLSPGSKPFQLVLPFEKIECNSKYLRYCC